MTILRIFGFISVFLFLFTSVSAFEDTFQYYPGGDISSTWYANHANSTNDGDATYSRSGLVYVDTEAGWTSANMYNLNPSGSNYWAFTLRDYQRGIYFGLSNDLEFNIKFYDRFGNQIFNHAVYSGNDNQPTIEHGRWEYYIDDSGVYLIINGVNQGSVGGSISTPYYIEFYTNIVTGVGNPTTSHLYIDDVTTTGYTTGISTESTLHTVTEINLNPTNISYGIKSYPAASYQASEYKIDIKRSIEGVYVDVQDEIVKGLGNTTPYYGFSNWNRSADLTGDDLDYGLYMVYLTDDGTSVDTDYFFLAPPGDSSSISFSNSEIPIGTTDTITYSIDAADFGTYNYHVRIYSTTEQIQATQVTETSSTVSWDTTGESTGLHYAVLSRTDKTSGAYSELIYDIATLSEDIVLRGHIYDAQNETVLDNVSVNFSQASTWYNTTSDVTGYYELSGLVANVETNVNASLENYTHENFTFTPLSAEIYTVDLYLINNTPTYDNTTIGGLTYDYPLHQAVTNSTVNIYNATWSDSTTSSSITGFYLFEELTNGSYDVNATKTDYQDSDEYPVDTNNGSWETQNILLYGIYDLTIRAQDATTEGYLSSFSVDYGGIISSTTNGTLTYSGLTYGLYTFSVSATGYYSSSEDILVDSTKTETIELSQTTSPYYDPSHYVKFTVQSIWGTKYSGVDVSVYEGSDTSTTNTGVTGSDGSVAFEMDEDVQYRLTFINTTAGISETRTLYPVDDHYYIIVSTIDDGWDTYPTPISDAIDFTLTKSIINSTHAYINVSYNDSLAETTDLKVYLNQTNESDYFNQTNLDTWAPGATSSGNHSFIVSDYSGESYIVHLVVEHTTYGEIDSTYSVSFKDDISSKFPGIPPSVFLYVSIFLLLFFGGIFVSTNVEKGMLLVCILFFVLYGLGGFSSLPSNVQNSMLAGGILGFILSIIANLNKGNKDEGFR
jgi:hypothetical protein